MDTAAYLIEVSSDQLREWIEEDSDEGPQHYIRAGKVAYHLGDLKVYRDKAWG